MTKHGVVNLVLAFMILILYWLVGKGLSYFIALPAALLGLLLLFMTLFFLGRVPKPLESVSQFCVKHLSFFFIPPLVAAWLYAKQLGDHLWLFLFAVIVSTFISLCVTSWLGQRLLSDKPNKQDDKG